MNKERQIKPKEITEKLESLLEVFTQTLKTLETNCKK